MLNIKSMLQYFSREKLGSGQLHTYVKLVANYSSQPIPKADNQPEKVVYDNPDPSGRLKTTFVSIFQKVVHKLGTNHKPTIHTIPYKPVKAGHTVSLHKHKGNLWRSTLAFKWPQEMTFESWSSRKVLAERSNIKAALEKLRELGALDGDDQPDLSLGTVLKDLGPVLARLNPPSPVWIEAGLVGQVDFVTSEYKRLESSIKAQPYECHRRAPDLTAKLGSSLMDAEEEEEIGGGGLFGEMEVSQQPALTVPKIRDIITGQVITTGLDGRRRDAINARLFDQWNDRTQNCAGEDGDMMLARRSLPIALKREEIMETVSRNSIVVLSGDTGSGKSTQVPQYLREHMVEAGRATDCAILVTQPRRISAISLAQRVAAELGQTTTAGRANTNRPDHELDRAIPGWDHVGFHVRLYQRLPRKTTEAPILFCTPGILLRKLQHNPDLEGVSHVIVDEVHEHDVLTDFLLAVLKRITKRNPDLRVVLMSATINTQKFSSYFHDCPILNVKGRMFPVNSYYLPEVCQLLRQPSHTTKLTLPSNSPSRANVATNGLQVAASTAATTTPKLDVKLLVQTVTHVHCTEPRGGAILVFLPGWSEIKKVKDELDSWNRLQRHGPRRGGPGGAYPMHVLTVHSSLSQDEQSRIFEPASKLTGRKVILSTNITETAVTIGDVVYVVDSGLAKENKYNTDTGVSYLDLIWASKSNIRQRQGRAGRVQAGKSYHLFTREFYDTLPDHPVPEILRIPLESIVLEAKLIASTDPGLNLPATTDSVLGFKAADFLSSLIVPPTQNGIQAALTILRDELGFLDQDESLTHLGQRLVGVTCHPRLSLAMAWASFFRCPGPVVSLAAAMSHNRSLLLNRRPGSGGAGLFNNGGAGDEGSSLKDIKLKYAPVPGSDHLAHVRIYEMWKQSYEMGRDYRMLYEEENGIDWRNARFIDGIRSQLGAELVGSGLAERSNVSEPMIVSSSTTNSTSKFHPDSASNLKLLRAILGASFYPNVAKVIYGDIKRGQFIKDSRRLVAAGSQNRNGLIVPSSDSLCSDRDHYDTDWVTFLSVLKLPHRNNACICRDLSTFSPIALALFSGRTLDIVRPESLSGEPDLAEHAKDGRVLIRLDGEPMLTFATRDTATAERLIKLRSIITGLFGYFLKVGVAPNSHPSHHVDDEDEVDDDENSRILQLRKEIVNLCKRLIETNT